MRATPTLLNAIFAAANAPLLTTLTMLNPAIDRDAVLDKASVLDIKAKTETGAFVDIEIQPRHERDMPERSLYCWAKLYEPHLSVGNTYDQLQDTVGIAIPGFHILPTARYHNVFRVQEVSAGFTLTDHGTALPKLTPTEPLVRWMFFLLTHSHQQLEQLTKGDAVREKTMTVLD